MRQSKKKKRQASASRFSFRHLIVIGITLSFFSLVVSLILCLQPDTLAQIRPLAQEFAEQASQAIDRLWKGRNKPEETAAAQADTEEKPESGTDDMIPEEYASSPYLISSGELGEADDFDAYLETEPDEAVYYFITDSAIGPMIYYNQGDSRWGDYLYGGYDPLRSHGCGPTAVAMVITSFTPISLTPPEAADWAVENGCYARDSGSYHRLIPDSLAAYGLKAESVTDRSVENVSSLLENGHILVALMGRGSLTQNGHFIIITRLLDNGNVRIADPNSYENSTKEWRLDQLLSELKYSRDSGAPLWAVSFAEGE